jgi:hypothetical protein
MSAVWSKHKVRSHNNLFRALEKVGKSQENEEFSLPNARFLQIRQISDSKSLKEKNPRDTFLLSILDPVVYVKLEHFTLL